MNFFKEYTTYIKNNPQGYWFKRKLYGWGWIPANWKGWLVTIGYIVATVCFALTVDETSPRDEILFTFIIPVVLLTIAFLRIAYRTGEKPKWQWGEPRDEE